MCKKCDESEIIPGKEFVRVYSQPERPTLPKVNHSEALQHLLDLTIKLKATIDADKVKVVPEEDINKE